MKKFDKELLLFWYRSIIYLEVVFLITIGSGFLAGIIGLIYRKMFDFDFYFLLIGCLFIIVTFIVQIRFIKTNRHIVASIKKDFYDTKEKVGIIERVEKHWVSPGMGQRIYQYLRIYIDGDCYYILRGRYKADSKVHITYIESSNLVIEVEILH